MSEEKKKKRDSGKPVMMLEIANVANFSTYEIILISLELEEFTHLRIHNRVFVLSGHVLLVIYISDSSPIDDVLLFSKYVMLAISMTRPELSRSLGRSVVVGLLVLCFVD